MPNLLLLPLRTSLNANEKLFTALDAETEEQRLKRETLWKFSMKDCPCTALGAAPCPCGEEAASSHVKAAVYLADSDGPSTEETPLDPEKFVAECPTKETNCA